MAGARRVAGAGVARFLVNMLCPFLMVGVAHGGVEVCEACEYSQASQYRVAAVETRGYLTR
ncbi:hypothetical protein BS329_15535 [Amycolatopsis coloradensis]|uniref:Uncharacterized protein n=1 Tax=Amycolatopsis coloradensis TaxID=76021 RepID=A0A1R0KUB9_9PSEU|nr:hypothetical protein BS329_15535 [Amycolatopsis coloradensis]